MKKTQTTSRRALYSGSFDPITCGHLDIIERIESQFDEIVILVANSLSKDYLFSVEELVAMIQECTGGRIKVESTEGLLVDYARKNQISTIVRGLRAVSDFEYEYAMANMNRTLDSAIETMIVFTRPEYSFIASRMVKEVASHNGCLEGLVPESVGLKLKEKLKKGMS